MSEKTLSVSKLVVPAGLLGTLLGAVMAYAIPYGALQERVTNLQKHVEVAEKDSQSDKKWQSSINERLARIETILEQLSKEKRP